MSFKETYINPATGTHVTASSPYHAAMLAMLGWTYVEPDATPDPPLSYDLPATFKPSPVPATLRAMVEGTD